MTPDIVTPFGKHLWSLMQERGLTQYRLAKLAGVNPGQIAKLLRREAGGGLAFRFDTAYRIACALEITLDELYPPASKRMPLELWLKELGVTHVALYTADVDCTLRASGE